MKLISKKLCIINNCDVWVRYFWINTALILKITFCQKILSSLLKCYCCSIAHHETNQSFTKHNGFPWVVLYVIIIKFTEEVKKQQHAMVTVLSFTTGICRSVSDRLPMKCPMTQKKVFSLHRIQFIKQFSCNSFVKSINLNTQSRQRLQD